MSNGFTTVSAQHLQDATGTPVTNATISFLPVDNRSVALSFRAGGAGEGQVISQAVTALVTAGAFTIQLADTSLTSPVNVGYRVTITDNVSGLPLSLGTGYACVQPTGDAWSLDTYIPALSAQVTVQAGPQGESAYQVAVDNGFEGTQAQWLASLYGVQGQAGTNGTNGTNGADGATSYATLSSAIGAATTHLRASIGAVPIPNLFNVNSPDCVPGLLKPDGSIDHAYDSNCRITNWLDVSGCTQFTTNVEIGFGGAGGAIIYRSPDGVVISNATADLQPGTYDLPAGTTQMRTTVFFGNDFPTAMIVGGSVLPSTYQPFVGVLPENTNLSREAVAINVRLAAEEQFVSSKFGSPLTNLYDYTKVIPGKLKQDGTVDNVSYPGTFYTTDFMTGAASPNLVMTMGYGGPDTDGYFIWYAADKTTIIETRLVNVTAGVPFPGNPLAVYWRAWGYTAPDPRDGIFASATLPSIIPPYRLPSQPAWFGKTFCTFTDSIFHESGVSAILAQTNGMVRKFADEVSGRLTQDIFNAYAGNSPTGLAVSYPYTTNTTLAQNLAGVDLIIVSLTGNNMGAFSTLGSFSDAPSNSGASLAASIRWAIEGLQAAAPNARIVWVSPYQTPQHVSSAGVVQMLQLICQDYGVPVLDMASNSGINKLNWDPNNDGVTGTIRHEAAGITPTLAGHLSNRGRDVYYLPVLSRWLQMYVPGIA